MHISSCLHPKTIVNPYTKERQVVSCGECAACRNRAAHIWCQRLDQERYCWKYCWFFTLTYNEDNVPTLINQNGIYIPTDTRHINPDSVLPCYNYWDNSPKLDASEVINMKSFMTSYDKCYYVSRYDVQCFMKRLRINLKRLFQSDKNFLNEKDYKIRYYISSEYGPKGKPYRPHYHGLLFFNSSFTAANIHSLLLKSWKFGFVNSSAVSETNSHYVASYLNCVADLPHIYKKGAFRPFALMSKAPPIGSLCASSTEIRSLFDTCSPTFVIADHSKGLFDNVPLWRNYKDSLFPRLSGFDEITHYDRITLYGVFKRISQKVDLSCFSAASFMSAMQSWHEKGDSFNYYHLSSVCRDYVDFLYRRTGNYQPLMRWWFISSRVCEQCRIFDVSLSDYVNRIETFYDNCKRFNLDKYYNYQEDFASKFGSQSLIGLDSLYLRSLIGLDASQLSYEDITILDSYGIELDKFFSSDSAVQQEYVETLLPENTYDYLCFRIDSECKRRKHQRSKDKNETIDRTICGF